MNSLVNQPPESISYWASYQNKQDAKVDTEPVPKQAQPVATSTKPTTKVSTLRLNKLITKFSNNK